jgi:stage II sporulation protein D
VPKFVITGHGWGHGIGMPQYGAYGYAQHGSSYSDILDHFYPGTAKGKAGLAKIRVLLDAGRSSVSIHSDSAWTVRDGQGRSWTLAPGTKSFPSSLRVGLNGKTRALTSPVTLTRKNGGALDVGGRPYRGSIVLRNGAGLSIINSVGLEAYLKGVVPGEMPASWHPEALKAQAVAARSYALASRHTGGTFDVYDDTRSQVYYGMSAELPTTNSAVNATAHEIRTFDGHVATTFFYSSSGGRTASVHDVWGSAPVPYLRSVVDQYDTISPYHNWGPYSYTRAKMDSLLGSQVSGLLLDLTTASNPSRRIATVTMKGTRGSTSMSGESFRFALGLRSSWFHIGVLNLTSVKGTVAYGKGTYLSGIARGLGKAWLESKHGSGSWTKVRDLEVTASKTFKTLVKPTTKTSYRVRTAQAVGPTRTLKVATNVAFAKPTDRSGLSGVVLPRRNGVKVTIQKLTDAGTWKAVKSGTTTNGNFTIAFAVQNKTYRAVATVPGYLAGVSPTLAITG